MSYGQEPSELSVQQVQALYSSAMLGTGPWLVSALLSARSLTQLLLNPWVVIHVSSWLFVSLKLPTVEQTWSTDVVVSTPSSFRGPDISFPASSCRRFRLEDCLLDLAQQRRSEPHICSSSGFPPPHP